jgi:hypothetical protein
MPAIEKDAKDAGSAMSEPSTTDILHAIKELAVETRTRHETLANESRSRDTAQTESRARLEAKVEESVRSLTLALTTVHADVAQLKSLFPKVESLATQAHEVAMAAQKSYDDVTLSSQEQWRGVVAGQEMLAKMLEAQNEEKRRSDEAKAHAREQESLAAKRLIDEKDKATRLAAERAIEENKAALLAAAEKAHDDAEERERIRTHDENRRKARYGTIQAIVLALIASAGGCGMLNARQSATDAASKIDAQSRQLTALSEQVKAAKSSGITIPSGFADTVSVSAASSPPESSLTPPAAAAAPAKPAAPPPRLTR